MLDRSSNQPTLDLSQLSLVLKPDAREPPVFRGDGADRCSIDEWIELMSTYLRRKNAVTSEQSDEILIRLMGRAKDVVRNQDWITQQPIH